MIKELFH